MKPKYNVGDKVYYVRADTLKLEMGKIVSIHFYPHGVKYIIDIFRYLIPEELLGLSKEEAQTKHDELYADWKKFCRLESDAIEKMWTQIKGINYLK